MGWWIRYVETGIKENLLQRGKSEGEKKGAGFLVLGDGVLAAYTSAANLTGMGGAWEPMELLGGCAGDRRLLIQGACLSTASIWRCGSIAQETRSIQRSKDSYEQSISRKKCSKINKTRKALLLYSHKTLRMLSIIVNGEEYLESRNSHGTRKSYPSRFSITIFLKTAAIPFEVPSLRSFLWSLAERCDIRSGWRAIAITVPAMPAAIGAGQVPEQRLRSP